MILAIPITYYTFYGKFTYSFKSALEYDEEIQKQSLDCTWGITRVNNFQWECNDAPCKTYNIDGLECIREGYTNNPFDNSIYYVCKDYGRVQKYCIDYYDTREEFYGYDIK